MSFSKSLNKAVDDIVLSYIRDISVKYNIDKTELYNLWNSSTNIDNKVSESKSSENKSSDDTQDLSKLTVSELKTRLADKGMKVSGVKQELIDRLLNADKDSSSKPKTLEKTTKPENVPKSTLAPVLNIRRNNFNNYEHSESGLVFNTDKRVIGKQKSDGTIEVLNAEHIQLCNKYKFDYIIPENLDSGKNLKSVRISELDDEEEDLDIDDIIDDEEDDIIDDEEEDDIIDEEELDIDDE